MEFDLHIFIGGVCLFVPTSDGTTFVLMPSTERDCALASGDDIHPHIVRLAFDAGYRDSRITLKERIEHRPLEWMQLSFEGLGIRTTTPATIPSEVIDVQQLSGGQPLIPDALAGCVKVPEAIEARLVLNSGCITGMRVTKGRISGPPQQMAHLIRWTISNIRTDNDSLDVNVSPLRRGGSSQTIVTLRPRKNPQDPTKLEIRLYVVHVMPHEFRRFLKRREHRPHTEAMGCLPSLLGLGTRNAVEKRSDSAPHFRAFYCAFHAATKQPYPDHLETTPIWLDCDCGTNCRPVRPQPHGQGGSVETEEHRGFEHTCMAGKTSTQTRP